MTLRGRWRLLLGALGAGLALWLVAGLGAAWILPTVAAADPPGPTDYRTDVVAIEPPADDRVEVTIIGGDSFVALTVAPGVQVEVIGYRGEPYLRFDGTGVVHRNERSPTRWLNDERYGAVDVPGSASAEATPEWLAVADGGTYAWHDHRAHWMNEAKPPGAQVGGTVLEAEIPLVVDGEPVAVLVRSVLLAPPDRWPAVLGLGLGAVSVAAAVRRRNTALAPAITAVWAAIALFSGLWAFRSVPPETGPSLLLWLLPAIGVGAAVATAVVMTNAAGRTRALLPPVLALLAGVELVVWSWLRREALVRALIPSDAPGDLDRAVIAGSLVVGAATVVLALPGVLRPSPAVGRDGTASTGGGGPGGLGTDP